MPYGEERFVPPRSCAIVASKAVKIEAVISVSTLRKLGSATRMVQQQAGRNRLFSALTGAAMTTVRSFGRAMHSLWLEGTGTVFLSMAVFGAAGGVRQDLKCTAAPAAPGAASVSASFRANLAPCVLRSIFAGA